MGWEVPVLEGYARALTPQSDGRSRPERERSRVPDRASKKTAARNRFDRLHVWTVAGDVLP
jgi:hypothetical protein